MLSQGVTIWGKSAPLTPFEIFGLQLLGVYKTYADDVVVAYLASTPNGEALTNGDFETGDPPDDWADVAPGVRSAVAGFRTGGSGTQVMRSTYPAAPGNGTIQQNAVMVVGARYRATGWARGDGVNGQPRFRESGATLWNGTTSTSWQTFDVTFTATGANAQCVTVGNGGTVDYSDWDDVSIVGVADQLSNGDFEDGDPPDDWLPQSAAVLSSQAGAPGGTGTQVMRVTCLAGDAFGTGAQFVGVVGARYRITGRARGDGIARPEIRWTGGGGQWVGTSSTSWQQFAIESTATNTRFDCATNDVTASGVQVYTEWDDVTCVEIPHLVTAPNDDLLARRNTTLFADPFHFTQPTSLNQSWLNPIIWGSGLPAGEYDGVAHWHHVDPAAARFTGDDKAEFALMVIELASAGQGGAFLSTGNSASNNPRNDFFDGVAVRYVSVRDDDAASGPASATTTLATDTDRHVVAVEHSGTTVTIWVDGVVTSVYNTASNVGTSTFDQVTFGALRRIGVANFLAFNLREIWFGMGPVSDAQMVAATQILAFLNPLT